MAPVVGVEQHEVGVVAGARRPLRSARASTCAALTVQAESASPGERRSCVHASEQTSGRLSQNALPGLKSVASATAAPASTSARARHRPAEEERACGQQDADDVARASAPRRLARGLEVVDRARAELDRERDRAGLRELVAMQRSARPRRGSAEVAARLVGVEGTRSRKTSAASASRAAPGSTSPSANSRYASASSNSGGTAWAPSQVGTRGTAIARSDAARCPGRARSRIRLEGGRTGAEHPAAMAPDRPLRALPRRRRASPGRSRGSRRPPRGAPRSSRLRHAGELLDTVARESRHAYGSRRARGSRGDREPSTVEVVRRARRGRASTPRAVIAVLAEDVGVLDHRDLAAERPPQRRVDPRRRRQLREVAYEQRPVAAPWPGRGGRAIQPVLAGRPRAPRRSRRRRGAAPRAGVGREHALEPLGQPSVPSATTTMPAWIELPIRRRRRGERSPRSRRRRVQQRVQDRPVGDPSEPSRMASVSRDGEATEPESR